MRSSAGALLGEGAGAHEPLVRELVARIGAGADDEGVGADLFHVASSLGGLLRGGVGAAMGRLGFKSTVVTKPKPSDHARVVLFVIGGLTPCEIREIGSIAEDVRAAFESGASRHSGVKVEDVCVGGTGLLVGDRDFLRLVCEVVRCDLTLISRVRLRAVNSKPFAGLISLSISSSSCAPPPPEPTRV